MSRTPTPPEQRFWAKVRKTETCWIWTAAFTGGFPQFRYGEHHQHGSAIRFAYELAYGAINSDDRVQQTCGNRQCVRPEHLTVGVEGRFWMKVDKNGPIHHRLGRCWLWTGAVRGNTKGCGYGQFCDETGRSIQVHRYSYELAYGPITPGMDIDHRCRRRLCIRPTHLREATRKQNMENQGPNIRSVTGARGVSLVGIDALTGASWYRVTVGHNGSRLLGGFFTDLDAASKAAVALRNKYFTHNDEDRLALV